jgi:type I site-specific restriction-modification system R (restriction) subunit
LGSLSQSDKGGCRVTEVYYFATEQKTWLESFLASASALTKTLQSQISRYANTRDDEDGVKKGEERFFLPNLFSIITHGTEARFGTIIGEFDHYLNWKDIFPEVYWTVQVKTNEERYEVLILGMLNKAVLLDMSSRPSMPANAFSC